MGRKEYLEQNILESYKLICEFEEILRLSDDPKEKARVSRDIEEQWALVHGYLEEYEPLLRGRAIPAHIAEIAAHFPAYRESPPPVTGSSPIAWIKRRVFGHGAVAGPQVEADEGKSEVRDDRIEVEKYLLALLRSFELLPLLPTHPDQPLRLRLEDMYIPLMTLSDDRWEGSAKPDVEQPPQSLSDSSRVTASPPSPGPGFAEIRRIPITQMFVEYPYLVVLGDPGSGKTTFLNYLAITFARAYLEQDTRYLRDRLEGFEQILLPIHVPVRTFSEYIFRRGGESPPVPTPEQFLDFFLDYLSQSDIVLLREFVRKAFSSGQCLFLFDGVDEGGAIAQRAYMAEAISTLRNAYPENRFLVTSRRHGYQPLSAPFRTCAIHELEDSERRALVFNWCRAVALARSGGKSSPDVEREAEENAKQLIAQIEANPSVYDLAANPLLLTAIAVVYELRGGFTRRRVDLYKECIELLVGSRDVGKILTGRSTTVISGMNVDEVNERKECLERLGLWFQENEGYEFISRHELENVLRDLYLSRGFSPERAQSIVAGVVRFFRERGGIFEERQPECFNFSLRAFQEYFAARAIVNKYDPDPGGYLLYHVSDKRWHEVIRLVAGHLSTFSIPGPVRFVRELLRNTDSGDELNQRIEAATCNSTLLAAECLIEIGTVTDIALCREIINRLAHAFEKTKVQRLRYAIAETLGKLPEGMAGPILYNWLRSNEDEVKAAAIRGIIHLPVESVFDEIIEKLLLLAVDKRREHFALEKGSEERRTSLEIEHYAVLGLARIARTQGETGRRLSKRLIKELKSGDAAWRQVAAQVLTKVVEGPEDELGSVLKEALWSSPDRHVRWICARGLASLGMGPDRLLSVADLQKMLEDNDWMVRAEAAKAASALDRKSVTAGLLDRLLYRALWDDEREVLSAASSSLGSLAPPSFCERNREKILSAFKDDREEVRAAAARVFGKLGRKALDERVRQELVRRILEDPSDQVGYAAAKALARIGPTLLEVGEDGGGDSRACLKNLLDAASGLAYTEHGESKLGPYTRSALCMAVSRIGIYLEPVTIAETLIRHVLLVDPVPELRSAAAQAVEELGIEMIRDPDLVKALTNTIQERILANKSQQDLDKTESDSTVRAAILRLLAQDVWASGEEQFLDLVCLAAREDEAREVRCTALQILGSMYSKSGTEAARDALLFACERDPDAVVRSVAHSALVQAEAPIQREQIFDILDATHARRAVVRKNLERLLENREMAGILKPSEALGVKEEIIAALRMNFQLQAPDKPPEELRSWVQVTDYGLTRMQLEVCFENAMMRHISPRDPQRVEAAKGMCAQLMEKAIFQDFYVRPKPVGDALRKSEDWQRAKDEIREFCRYFEKPHMIGQDYAEAEDRLRNALHSLRRLTTYGLARRPLSYKDPASPPTVREKVKLLRREIDDEETNPLRLKFLLEQIERTPKWSDLS